MVNSIAKKNIHVLRRIWILREEHHLLCWSGIILLTSVFLGMRKKNAYRRNICYSLTNKNASVGTKNCFISVLTRRQIFLSEELSCISIKKNWHLECAPKHFVGMHTLTHVLTTCWLSSAGGLGKNPFLRGPSTETWHIKRPPYCTLTWLQQETLKILSHVFVFVYFATLYTLIIFPILDLFHSLLQALGQCRQAKSRHMKNGNSNRTQKLRSYLFRYFCDKVIILKRNSIRQATTE